jgi:hypothetical protein
MSSYLQRQMRSARCDFSHGHARQNLPALPRSNGFPRECSHGIGILERKAATTRPKRERMGHRRDPSPGLPGRRHGLEYRIRDSSHSNRRRHASVRLPAIRAAVVRSAGLKRPIS